jgi:hypothetical protein
MYYLESAEGGRSQDSETKGESKGHSQTGEYGESDK